MDRVVLDAYGWRDIHTAYDFLAESEDDEDERSNKDKQWRYRWPDEVRDEVLARLLALNVERAAAERANEPLAPCARAKRAARGLAKAELPESMAADEDD